MYNSSGLQYYRHSDWLGSSRLASTPTRTVYSSTAYAPFGENYGGGGTTDLSFTGQNQDTVPGLNDFMFREHTPNQGRWISPDPAGLAAVSLTDPQSWNRYAYVTNRPMASVDPLGLYFCDFSSIEPTSQNGGGDNQATCEGNGGTWVPEPGDPDYIDVPPIHVTVEAPMPDDGALWDLLGLDWELGADSSGGGILGTPDSGREANDAGWSFTTPGSPSPPKPPSVPANVQKCLGKAWDARKQYLTTVVQGQGGGIGTKFIAAAGSTTVAGINGLRGTAPVAEKLADSGSKAGVTAIVAFSAVAASDALLFKLDLHQADIQAAQSYNECMTDQ